ncbi:uncharacterized protein LOC136036884 [Artemia franciscana]|uniref:uncharacterized protein LOC136036884 n=1 Tax=Artemia franciscana TaxID=6661 RepID=UPI0032D9C64C
MSFMSPNTSNQNFVESVLFKTVQKTSKVDMNSSEPQQGNGCPAGYQIIERCLMVHSKSISHMYAVFMNSVICPSVFAASFLQYFRENPRKYRDSGNTEQNATDEPKVMNERGGSKLSAAIPGRHLTLCKWP